MVDEEDSSDARQISTICENADASPGAHVCKGRIAARSGSQSGGDASYAGEGYDEFIRLLATMVLEIEHGNRLSRSNDSRRT